jgi:hypothetical protein
MIELSILIAFSVLFIHTTTNEGHIFEDVANWLDTKLPDWIIKPLYGCPICMSFWYGSIFYIIYEGVNIEMIIVVFCAAGINAAIVNLNNTISDLQGNTQDTN